MPACSAARYFVPIRMVSGRPARFVPMSTAEGLAKFGVIYRIASSCEGGRRSMTDQTARRRCHPYASLLGSPILRSDSNGLGSACPLCTYEYRGRLSQIRRDLSDCFLLRGRATLNDRPALHAALPILCQLARQPDTSFRFEWSRVGLPALYL